MSHAQHFETRHHLTDQAVDVEAEKERAARWDRWTPNDPGAVDRYITVDPSGLVLKVSRDG
jgi:hypothetical protein